MLNHDLAQISTWAKQWLVDLNPNKTEAILFSLKNDQTLPKLVFNETEISFVDHHKHLGLTLSSNGQWSNHIENIIISSSKVLNIMRKLKFQLTRQALNQLYVSYIRPLLEYASIVWDGCTNKDAETLEKLQNEAARIVTGLTRSVSIDKLYNECCWEPLANRRERQKLCFMYKATHDVLPTYINDLIPHTIADSTVYLLRNRNNLTTIQTRTTIFQKSCIPSSINLWNSTNTDIRGCTSLNSFKNALIVNSNVKKVPPHFLLGNRYRSVLHARIRNNCSNLNHDLFTNHIRDDPLCSCTMSIMQSITFSLV